MCIEAKMKWDRETGQEVVVRLSTLVFLVVVLGRFYRIYLIFSPFIRYN